MNFHRFCFLNFLAILACFFFSIELKAQCTAVAGSLGGTGTYCFYDLVNVGIPLTKTDQTYQWLRNGNTVTPPLPGTGGNLSFQFNITSETEAGTYTVRTTKEGCEEVIFGNVVVTYGEPIQQTVTAPTGTPCLYSPVDAVMTSSQSGVEYRLHGPGGYISKMGTGASLTFTFPAHYSNYYVEAINATCSNTFGHFDLYPGGAYAIPLSEGFNTSGTNIFPVCWRQEFVTGTDNLLFVTSSNSPSTTPQEGARHVSWASSVFTAGNKTKLVSAAFNPGGSADVEFYWFNQNDPAFSQNDGVQVKYSFDGTNWYNAGNFIPRHDPTSTLAGQWKKKTVSIPATNNEIIVAFEFVSANGRNCSLDGVIIKSTACPTATGISAGSITNNSASISYTGSGNFIIEYGPVGFSPGFGSLAGSNGIVVTSSVSPKLITGLSGNTAYDLYIRKDCGNGFIGANSALLNFRTLCDAVTLPYYEGFNTSDQQSFPDCWSQQFVVNSTSVIFPSSSESPETQPFEGNRFAFFNSYNYPLGKETRLVSRRISTSGIALADVRFHWYNHNSPYYNSGTYLEEGVQVQYSTNGSTWTNAGAFIPRQDASLPSNTAAWKMKRISLPAGAGNQSTLYIGLKFHGSTGANCSVDNFSVVSSSTCGNISGLVTSSVTATTVNFQWTVTAGATGYEYFVSNSAIPPASGNITSSNSASQSSLIGSSIYYIHVRSKCNSIAGNWSTISFTTSPDCSSAPLLTLCSAMGVVIPAGSGAWDFSGNYPFNSLGSSTPGFEKLLRFVAPSTGVYYVKVNSVQAFNALNFLYKPASGGCSNTGWTGIAKVYNPNNYPIGMLQAGTEYYILIDGGSLSGNTINLQVCKATVGALPDYNNCYSNNFATYYNDNNIPANSPREEFIIDGAGNLLASLDFSNVSNSVGTINSSEDFLHQGKLRRDNDRKEYLDRSFRLSTSTPPANPLQVKLFFTNSDLQKLIDEPNDGVADVNSISDLHCSVTNRDCTGVPVGEISSFYPQTGNGSYDAGASYIQISTSNLNGFFLHGGNSALEPSTYICPGYNTSFTITSLGGSFSYQWQVDDGAGYTNLVDDATYTGSLTNSLSLNAPPTSWYGYKYRCIASDGSTIYTSPARTLRFRVGWQGFTSADWSNANNWECGVVPDQYTDVVIYANSNKPVISSNATCRSLFLFKYPNVTPYSLTITNGATLTITGQE